VLALTACPGVIRGRRAGLPRADAGVIGRPGHRPVPRGGAQLHAAPARARGECRVDFRSFESGEETVEEGVVDTAHQSGEDLTVGFEAVLLQYRFPQGEETAAVDVEAAELAAEQFLRALGTSTASESRLHG
jgi:hypothetical protein